MLGTIDMVVIGIYFAVLLSIGFSFKKFNSSVSDYFRSGGQGSWWLIGASMFMASVSTATFTGNASVAYTAGWSILWIYIGGLLGMLPLALFLAAWFRQMRLITFPEALRERYGVSVQQFYAWATILLGVLGAAVMLWAMAIFFSATFDLPVHITILVLGVVVFVYSVTGGCWAVMATDFVQSLVLLPIAVLIALLCLIELGGINGLFDHIRQAGLEAEMALVKPVGIMSGAHSYSWKWVVAFLFFTMLNSMSMSGAVRFFSVKDGREAKKSVWFLMLLSTLGMLVWFIPPITARLLYADQVHALGQLANPADGAFAVAALQVLPNGMAGVLLTAMFSASMSSIDTGINRNAAMFVRDILPALFRLFGVEVKEDASLLRISRLFTFIFAAAVIGLALMLARGRTGIFDILMQLAATITAPLAMPLIFGLFFRRVPWWAAFSSMGAAFLAAVFALLIVWEPTSTVLQDQWGFTPWSFEKQLLVIMLAGFSGFMVSRPFYRFSTPAYRSRTAAFFERMHTPVDFSVEVGKDSSSAQLCILGGYAALIGSLMFLLLFLPNTGAGRMMICMLSVFVTACGAGMFYAGHRAHKRNAGHSSENVG